MYGNPNWKKEFDAQHGNDGIQVTPGRLLFSDGAEREVGPVGVTTEPPTDPFELARLQLQYHEEKLRRAVQEFAEMKRNLTAHCEAAQRSGYPPPESNEIKKLRGLKEAIKPLQEAVDAARKQVEEIKPESAIGRREAIVADNRARTEQVLAELSGIKI